MEQNRMSITLSYK
uniref:Uncharacterized protein n=1 Tax=Anguilla anguilla TaxID=7936 RepID=A0A0E9W2L1_ANGAN